MNEIVSRKNSSQMSNVYEGPDLINEIPLELRQEIFSYLNEDIKVLLQLAGTCKEWRMLSLGRPSLLIKLFSKKIPNASKQYLSGSIGQQAFLYEAALEARIRSDKIEPIVNKIKAHNGPIASLRPFGKNCFVSVGYDDSQAILWDAEKNVPLKTKMLNEKLPLGGITLVRGMEIINDHVIINTVCNGIYIWNVNDDSLSTLRISVGDYFPYKSDLLTAKSNTVQLIDLNNLGSIKELFQTDKDVKHLWVHNHQIFALKKNELEIREYEGHLIKKIPIGFPMQNVKKNDYSIIATNEDTLWIWSLENNSFENLSELKSSSRYSHQAIESWNDKFLLLSTGRKGSKIQILNQKGQLIKVLKRSDSSTSLTGIKGKVILGCVSGNITILDYNYYN